MKRYAFSTLVILTILTLTGCGDKELYEKEKVVEAYENTIPNAEFVGIKHTDGYNEWGVNTYTFTTGDFDFYVINDMNIDSMFGISTNDINSTYFYNLCEYLDRDLVEIANKHGLKYELYKDHEDRSERTTEDTVVIKSKSIDSYLSDDLSIVFYIMDFDGLKKLQGYTADLHNILEEYMLTDTVRKLNNPEMKYTIKYVDNEALKDMEENPKYQKWNSYYWGHIAERTEMEANRNLDYFENLYAFRVRTGEITDLKLPLDQAKQYKANMIEKLYVDGQEFISEDYNESVVFKYDTNSDSYYIRVAFGTDTTTEYSTGFKDSVQKEIIEETYSNSGYTIDTEKNTSAYVINTNEYVIKTVDSHDKMIRAYRNGYELNIDENSFFYASAPFTYISVEDFATLMEMKVDKIDNEEMAVYLVTEPYEESADKKIRSDILDWLEKLQELMRTIKEISREFI